MDRKKYTNKRGEVEKIFTFHMSEEVWEDLTNLTREHQISYKNFINNALKNHISRIKGNTTL